MGESCMSDGNKQTMNIPVGISDFTKIREGGYCYVDKSGLIQTLLEPEPAEVTLLTRPRRFGKTLAMSMLASFFDISKDSRHLFDGLTIGQSPELCSRWMNQYPVLFLSFKDVDGTSFENAFGLLKFTLSRFCDEHTFLETAESTTDTQRAIFQRLRRQESSLLDVQCSLLIIMKMLQSYYGKPVILLLDEYDVPLARASTHRYYDRMLEVIKVIMSTSLKDNTSLKFAVVTGCLKIVKESIFTGTNNFVSDTIQFSRFNEFFGFTQEEVCGLLKDMQAESRLEDVRSWYDGYHFGEYDIYCPWDVMSFLRDLQCDPEIPPASYWKNTSDNAIIRSFIDFAGGSITEKMEKLLAGDYIVQHLEEHLTYDYLHSSEDNLWTVLYMTGYLTCVPNSQLIAHIPDGMTALSIPNAEIRGIFETSIQNWFDDSAKQWDRRRLFDAVWNGESDVITQEMNVLLRMTISYHDYREDFYHAFLAGIFTGAGYIVHSNREHGEGRSDIVVLNPRGGYAAIFEAKYSQTVKNLEQDCKRALQQIQEKMYAAEFEETYEQVLCYGIAFCKKRCLVKKLAEEV